MQNQAFLGAMPAFYATFAAQNVKVIQKIPDWVDLVGYWKQFVNIHRAINSSASQVMRVTHHNRAHVYWMGASCIDFSLNSKEKTTCILLLSDEKSDKLCMKMFHQWRY